MMEPYSPVYFVIDRNHDIVRFSGADAGQYLEPSAGAASLNLFSILRRALRPDVRAAVQRPSPTGAGSCRKSRRPVLTGRSAARSR